MAWPVYDFINGLVLAYRAIKTDEMHWGALHIVVEDGNLTDADLEACLAEGLPLTDDDRRMLAYLRAMPVRIREIVWKRSCKTMMVAA